MKQIIITIAMIACGFANAIAQCSTEPNNFEIQLLQNHQSKLLTIQIRHHANEIVNQLPTTNSLLDGLIFAIANPINSDVQISKIQNQNNGFEMIQENQLNLYKTASLSETITTFYHNNVSNMPMAFGKNWEQDKWMTIATISYTGSVKEGSFFSLVTCDYGIAHPNGYEGNSTTDPWLSLYNATTQNFDQYSPKMITILPKVLATTNQLLIYPNPTSDLVNANFIGNANTAIAVKVIDAAGKTVKIINIDAEIGENKISFSIAELPIGIYQLQITDGKTLQLTSKIDKN
jgi:Secretion system C-terminal sorting domain